MGKAVRLDRFLADSGAGTRTEVKKLIQKGLVQVNGEKAKKPELKIDPETDVVEFDGEHIGARAEFVYYLLHKPAGYVSAMITGANTNEEFSAGGSFNTSSRQKKARITMRVEYRIK